MENQKAIENVQELGHVFADAVFMQTGVRLKSKSPLMNGIVAYEQLNLKGQWEYMDESIDAVVRMVYEMMIENIESDTLKIGRN